MFNLVQRGKNQLKYLFFIVRFIGIFDRPACSHSQLIAAAPFDGINFDFFLAFIFQKRSDRCEMSVSRKNNENIDVVAVGHCRLINMVKHNEVGKIFCHPVRAVARFDDIVRKSADLRHFFSQRLVLRKIAEKPYPADIERFFHIVYPFPDVGTGVIHLVKRNIPMFIINERQRTGF